MVDSLTNDPQNATPQEQQKNDLKVKGELIQKILAEIVAKNEDKKTLDGLELLLRLIGNITSKPTETKYRTIKSTIAKIQNTIFTLEGGISDLILAFGFVQTDAEHYVFVGDYFKVLEKGQRLTEKALEPIKVKFMTPEERTKWETLQEQKRIYQEEQAKKKAILDEQKKRSEYDQKERATMEVKTSKVNPNLKPMNNQKGVFVPPEPRKGG